MTGTYRSRDQRIADEAIHQHMQCTFCNAPTLVEELNTYGARCYVCYRGYCTQGRNFPSLSREDRREMAQVVGAALAGGLRANSRDHIQALEAKEAAGEATAGQRGFLASVRAALKGMRNVTEQSE